MGNEQSQLDRSADEAGQHADAEIKRWAAIERDQQLSKYREMKAKKTKRLAEKQAKAQDDLEEGEVTGEPEPTPPTIVPIRSLDSSQQTPTATDLLASFQPRKEKDAVKQPVAKANGEKLSDDEFLGFGNVPISQADKVKPVKKSPKLDTKASETINLEKRTDVNTSKTPSSAKPSSATPPTVPAKRPAKANAFADGLRPNPSSLPQIQKRTSVASPQSPDRSEGQQLPSVGNERPPKWYNETAVPTSRGRNEANVDTLLSSLRTQIEKCQSGDRTTREKAFTEIRDKLHKIVFCEVTGPLLKRHRMLHNDGRLAQLFDSRYTKGVNWPFDIRADARELYNKWCRRVFETDILRGIRFQATTSDGKKDKTTSSLSIEPSYRGLVPASYHGSGDLLNGQWWPAQLCTLRDGAHGSSQSGIYGKAGDGAYSCIMSGGLDAGGRPYPDQDEGDVVLYCGTDSDNGAVTPGTQRMLESINNHPVRLIRSHNAHTDYAPFLGYRYDGLYDVVDCQRMDPPNSLRQRHRFRLVRCAGQDPIRGIGAQKRPTEQEIHEYRKHQKNTGKLKGQV